MSGRFGGATFATLQDAPQCDVDGVDREIDTKDPNVATHACDAYDNS
jgi:hypothetical protein